MFNFFNRMPSMKFQTTTEDLCKMTNLTTNSSTEYYRVGLTSDGMTTLTIMGENGLSMTLNMNPSACEVMIRMLRSTYDLEDAMEVQEND